MKNAHFVLLGFSAYVAAKVIKSALKGWLNIDF